MKKPGFGSHVKKHALIYYFLLAFLISWIGWGMNLAYAMRWISFRSILFTLLGGLGPAIAAIVMAWILSGLQGVGRLLGAFFRKGARWTWFAVALALQPLITLAALGIESLLPGANMDFSTFPGALPFLAFFGGMLATNLWEEIGWRGFALPRLQQRFTPLVSSLILGFFWSLWHLPLVLNPIEEMAALPIGAILPYILALSILYTWLYNRANGNLSVVTFFHAMTNTIALVIMLGHPNFNTHYLVNAAVTILVAMGVAVFQLSPRANREKLVIS
jgi:membrane protease YdiL (CAAX protease family)